MIRINLLPHKKVKPMEKGVLRLWVLSIVLAVLAVVGVAGMWVVSANAVSELKDTKAATETQILELDKLVKTVTEYEQSRKELELKLDVISELEKQRVPLTKFFSELNRLLTEDIWFNSLSFNDTDFKISCGSVKEESVEPFVKSLKDSKVFENVERSRVTEVPGKTKGKKFQYEFVVSGELAGYKGAVSGLGKSVTELEKESAKAKAAKAPPAKAKQNKKK